MNQLLILLVIFSSVLIGCVFPYPTGVPERACVTMIPGHGASPQTSEAPFKVEVSPRIVRRGDIVQVVLSGPNPFQGFYLQGRTPEGIPVGTFIRSDTVKTHNCNGESNAAFHGVRGHKNNLEIFWKAPKDYQGQIIFTASFVQDFDTFWTFVRGNPITVKGDPTELAEGIVDFKNESVEIVPRILNRAPEAEATGSGRWKHRNLRTIPSSGSMHQEIRSPVLPNYAEFTAGSFVPGSVSGFAMRNRHLHRGRYLNQPLRDTSNFYFSQPEQSPLFPKMQINEHNDDNWGIGHNNQRLQNKINNQQLFPYKLEYNGNSNPYESHPNTFSTPSASPRPQFQNGGLSGSLGNKLSVAGGVWGPGGHRGQRNTVWVMDNRFQNFKDVDDLIPPTSHRVPSTKETFNDPLKSPHHHHLPLVKVSPITQLPPSYNQLPSSFSRLPPTSYNLGSGSGHHHHRSPGLHTPLHLSHYAPSPFPTTSFQPNPVGEGGGQDDDHNHHKTPSHGHHQFPTHGYLVHNPKSDGHSEPPFYLIPASKHDVDNVRGQYFNNPFSHDHNLG